MRTRQLALLTAALLSVGSLAPTASPGTSEAYCYNLPRELGLAGANPAYATKLSELVEALHFDSLYAEEIAAFVERS